MTRMETDYFRLNRILLIAIGIWPYDRTLLTRIWFIVLSGILITSVIFQLTALSTPECTIHLAIQILSCAASYSLFALKYNSFMINSYTVGYLIENLKNIYKDLKDENEIAIMKHYGSITSRYTAGLTWITVICLFFGIIYCCATPWLSFLDSVLLRNESHSMKLPVVTYYFVEEEKYDFLIQLHMVAATCIGTIALVATGTTILAYFKHICGIISIARYRIQQAIDQESESGKLEDTTVICKQIAYAVDFHRRALEFCVMFVSNFEGSFLVVIIFLVSGLSLHCFSSVINGDDIDGLLAHLMYVIPLLLYVLIANYSAQEVMDHCTDLFVTVYNVQWYNVSVKIQKMILFMLQRGNKSFAIIFGGIYAASVEGAGKIMSTSISYFTVLYSTQ